MKYLFFHPFGDSLLGLGGKGGYGVVCAHIYAIVNKENGKGKRSINRGYSPRIRGFFERNVIVDDWGISEEEEN